MERDGDFIACVFRPFEARLRGAAFEALETPLTPADLEMVTARLLEIQADWQAATLAWRADGRKLTDVEHDSWLSLNVALHAIAMGCQLAKEALRENDVAMKAELSDQHVSSVRFGLGHTEEFARQANVRLAED